MPLTAEGHQPIVWDAVVDALPYPIAFLDHELDIIGVNEAWLAFGRRNGLKLQDGGLGVNYRDVCKKAADDGAPQAWAVIQALKLVGLGAATHFALDYDCHSPLKKRWFTLVASRTSGGIVMLHRETTIERLVEAHHASVPRGLLSLLAGDRPVVREPVDIAPLIEATMTRQADRPPDLYVEEGMWMMADEALLVGAFSELARFAGGPIAVEAAEGEGQAVVTADYEVASGAWEGFGDEPFDWDAWPGGLGLPYVRAAVQAHDGWMLVRDEEHMRVYIALPSMPRQD